ncbi:MAG TPA: low affinity iron permease family protein [Bacteroidia bacterium]|jgi:low affinity Fe/Cu permease|nr:low affinity iron permease family protein [Bacteroidia bacterium]
MNNIKHKNIFEMLAHRATQFSGSTPAFMLSFLIIIIWLLSGPYFHFSDTWQLVINTGTTIITFLMVFLIQRMQNKDSKAIHLKLNELVAALEGPSNRLIDVEDLNEQELEVLANYYKTLAEMARHEQLLSKSHSIEEAIKKHKVKHFRHHQPSGS